MCGDGDGEMDGEKGHLPSSDFFDSLWIWMRGMRIGVSVWLAMKIWWLGCNCGWRCGGRAYKETTEQAEVPERYHNNGMAWRTGFLVTSFSPSSVLLIYSRLTALGSFFQTQIIYVTHSLTFPSWEVSFVLDLHCELGYPYTFLLYSSSSFELSYSQFLDFPPHLLPKSNALAS